MIRAMTTSNPQGAGTLRSLAPALAPVARSASPSHFSAVIHAIYFLGSLRWPHRIRVCGGVAGRPRSARATAAGGGGTGSSRRCAGCSRGSRASGCSSPAGRAAALPPACADRGGGPGDHVQSEGSQVGPCAVALLHRIHCLCALFSLCSITQTSGSWPLGGFLRVGVRCTCG